MFNAFDRIFAFGTLVFFVFIWIWFGKLGAKDDRYKDISSYMRFILGFMIVLVFFWFSVMMMRT